MKSNTKKIENPNGPNYTLRKSDILTIKYANGSKDVFSDTTQHLTRDPNNNQTVNTINYNEFIKIRSNDISMEKFLKDNDTILYKQFHRGTERKRAGGAFITSGILFTTGGVALIIFGNRENQIEDTGYNMRIAGTILCVIGPALMITSIPLYASGGGLKKRAADTYERQHYMNQTGYRQSIDFYFTGNGLSLAYKF